jgi:hypothetical protein
MATERAIKWPLHWHSRELVAADVERMLRKSFI